MKKARFPLHDWDTVVIAKNVIAKEKCIWVDKYAENCDVFIREGLIGEVSHKSKLKKGWYWVGVYYTEDYKWGYRYLIDGKNLGVILEEY